MTAPTPAAELDAQAERRLTALLIEAGLLNSPAMDDLARLIFARKERDRLAAAPAEPPKPVGKRCWDAPACARRKDKSDCPCMLADTPSPQQQMVDNTATALAMQHDQVLRGVLDRVAPGWTLAWLSRQDLHVVTRRGVPDTETWELNGRALVTFYPVQVEHAGTVVTAHRPYKVLV
jgi:hypothetical protein